MSPPSTEAIPLLIFPSHLQGRATIVSVIAIVFSDVTKVFTSSLDPSSWNLFCNAIGCFVPNEEKSSPVQGPNHRTSIAGSSTSSPAVFWLIQDDDGEGRRRRRASRCVRVEGKGSEMAEVAFETRAVRDDDGYSRRWFSSSRDGYCSFQPGVA
ncbi:hypothetical protein DY000_02059386 [Brassica cretica]|uniref:Uncharacterized protein n=1 Tax=Brassica cretica TaxID=69181 RepID=A0ABQ7AX86_BRACR|nr:hypothetical protein DY000_02059386 [Brassica cretica]